MEINKIAHRIEDKSKSLETITNNLENTQNQLDNIEGNSGSSDDPKSEAEDMASKLQSDLNVFFDVNSCSGNFNVDDFVQYKDNNNYYRYVTIKNTAENNVTIEGKNHKFNIITKDEAKSKILYKLTPSTSIDSYTSVEAAYKIQLNEIFQQFDEVQSKKDQAPKFKKTGKILLIVGSSLLSTSFTIIAIGLLFTLCCPLVTAILFIGSSLPTIAGIILMAIGGHNMHLSNKYLDDAKKMYDNARKDGHDLTHFLPFPLNDMHAPVASNMSLNTTVNKSLEGVFNATDPKNDVLNASMVSKPEHGNITINGTKFMYTPAEGYMGNDTFTFNVKDSMGFISNIARVNIQVKENIGAGNMSLNTTMNKVLEGVFNATDPDGGVLNAIVVSAPEHGNLTIHGTKFVYTPANSYVGNDTFSYRLKDSTSSLSNIGRVNIQVNALDNGNFLNILNMVIPLFNSETKHI